MRIPAVKHSETLKHPEIKALNPKPRPSLSSFAVTVRHMVSLVFLVRVLGSGL